MELQAEPQAEPLRKPPQSIEAEQSVLGGILLDNSALDQILDIVREEDFYRDAHRKIFATMVDMSGKEEAIDYLTLQERLKQRGHLEEIGGAGYISSLTDTIPTSANVTHYAAIVRDKAIARRLIHASSEILRHGFEASEDLPEYVDLAERLIFGVVQERKLAGVVHIKDLVTDSFATIERIYEKKETYTGVPSGFRDLDDKTSGFQTSDLIIIAGRPAMGKTSFALNIAQYAAQEAKAPVLFFSLEMSKESLAMRLLCSEARVDHQRVRKGLLTVSTREELLRGR